jgi:amino acid transporter
VFRKRLPDAHRPWRLPGGEFFSPLAFVVANLIILWAGWETDWKLGIAILLGYAILILNQVLGLNPVKPVLNWRAAQWLPVYLIGDGLIVYLSSFGPMSSPVFNDWWSMAVVAVFSLVIYYWAIAVSLETAEIQRMIDEIVVAEEEGVLE